MTLGTRTPGGWQGQRLDKLASPTFDGLTLSGETASRIAAFDAGKSLVSLDTATYPSLDEIANVKGVTSAIQTQIDGKEPTIIAGTSAKYWRGDKTWQTLDTAAVPENTNLYHTNARTIASLLTGYTSGAGIISAADSVLTAIQKLDGNIGALITGVSSVFGRSGAVTAQSGDYTTSQVTEGSNLYFTNARAQSAMSGLYETPLSFGTGLTRTVNTITVNTSQNIANLTNLATNGFVKTSGGNGTLSIDTSTYLTGNQTITLSGDISGSGATAITTTIGAGKVTNAMLAGSIAASKLVGTDIATLGTVTTGTWQGTAIAANKGGTGITSYAVGDLVYASGATTLSKLADVALGSVLVSGGVGIAPAWSSTLTLGNAPSAVTALNVYGYITGGGASIYTIPQNKVRLDLASTGAGGAASTMDVLFYNGSIFRICETGIAGTNDVFFQGLSISGSAGYTYLESWDGAGVIIGTGNNNSPVKIHINRSEVASFQNSNSYLRFVAGTMTSAPLKLTTTSAVLLTTPQSGVIECDSTGNAYYTPSNTRYLFSLSSATTGATDNAIVRWDGSSGNLTQNSLVTIDDTGNMTGALSLTVGNSLVANDILKLNSERPWVFYSSGATTASQMNFAPTIDSKKFNINCNNRSSVLLSITADTARSENILGVGSSAGNATLYLTRFSAANASALPYFRVDHVADTAITASTESPTVLFKLDSATRTWASGSLTIQRFIRIDQPTIAFAGASSVTDVATLGISGAPVEGANSAVTNTHGIHINAGAVSAAQNSYGITVNAQTGAANNYAAQFLGGNVGFLTSTPTAYIHVGAGTASANTAPIKQTSGTLTTTAESGTFEYNGSHYQTKSSGLRYAIGGVIADHSTDVSNTGTTETDLYSYTTPANTLAATGEKIIAEYAGVFNDATALSRIKVFFAGVVLLNTGALVIASQGSWKLQVSIIRTSASTARAIASFSSVSSSVVAPVETDLTGLTFTTTNVIKITGTASGSGGGTGDITAKMGTVFWYPSANN